MAAPNPTVTATNPRIAKLIELESRGVIKPEHEEELNVYRAQGLAPKGTSATLTQSQAQGAGFYGRALEADTNFGKTKAATNPRGLFMQDLADLAPGIANTMTSEDRQLADQAKRNFILASLRYESGAAIGKDEFTKQDTAFFPQPGDSDAVIAQKAKDRQVVIQGLRGSAGPGAAAMEHADLGTDHPVRQTGDIGDNAPPESRNPMTGDQQAAYDAWMKANPTATAEQVKAFGTSIGQNFQNVDDVIKARDKGLPVRPGSASMRPFKMVDPGDGTTGAVARGVADSLTVGALPRITAAVQSLRNGTNYGDELDTQQGVQAFDEQNHPYARFGGQLGGGVLGGYLVPGGAGRTAADLAKTGGSLGALYGVNNSADLTDIPNVVKNGVVGAATGAGAGYGLGKLGDLYRGRFGGGPATPPPTGNAVVDAAANQNIPIIGADAIPGTRGVTSFLETVPGSTGLIRNRMQAGVDAVENRVANLTPEHIMPADRTGVGEQVQAGAQNWIRRSGDIGGRLYDRAYQLSNGAQATPTTMLDTIDQHLGDLGRTPAANRQKIEALTTLRNDLVDPATGAPRPLDIDSLRNIRTGIREQMNAGNVRSSDLDRRLDEVMDAGRNDIQASLAGNPRALAAFGRADQFWADRVHRVDNVMSKVIGKADDPNSGEQVMAKIENLAAPRTGNSENLRSLLSSLRPDEREQVAANVAHSLGRATPDADFSAQRFFTQVNKLSPRARTAIFGQQGADALADLATVAEGRAGAQASLNNSGSGRVSNWWRALRGTMGIGVGYGAATSPVATAAGTTALLGGANLSARVLTNPAFARWAAQGFRVSTARGIENSLQRLGTVATSNPGIRAEVLGIQQRLAQAVNDNAPAVARAAASDGKGPDNEQ